MQVILMMLLTLFESIESFENDHLERRGVISIFIARIGSLVTVLALVFFATFLTSFLISEFKGGISANQSKEWYVGAVIGMPIFVPLLFNWFNRNYNYSTNIVNFIKVIQFANVSLLNTRMFFEGVFLIAYLLAALYFTLEALGAYVAEDVLIKFFGERPEGLVFPIILLHSVIYLSIRIIALPENTLSAKILKVRRELKLWALALIVTTVYAIYKISSSATSIEFFYLTGSILVSIVRTTGSYKELAKCYRKVQRGDDLQTILE